MFIVAGQFLKKLLWCSAQWIYQAFSGVINCVFSSNAQLRTILIGFFVAGGFAFAACNTNAGNMRDIFLSLGCGAGASVIATALTLHVTQQDRNQHLLATGVTFVGDKNEFNLRKKGKSGTGWDQWVEATPNYGHIILVGKELLGWIHSSQSLSSALKRNVKVSCYFLGTEEEAKERSSALNAQFSNELSPETISFTAFRCAGNQADDHGFYWNGKELVVKLYLPGTAKADAPHIAFDTQYAHPELEKNSGAKIPHRHQKTLEKFMTAAIQLTNSATPIT